MFYDDINSYLETMGYSTEDLPDGYDMVPDKVEWKKLLESCTCWVKVDYNLRDLQTAYSLSTYYTDDNKDETYVVRDGAFAGVPEITQEMLNDYVDELEREATAYIARRKQQQQDEELLSTFMLFSVIFQQ